MYYVICPNCGSHVEVLDNAVGEDRTELFNITVCEDCDLSFDYDDEEVKEEQPTTTEHS